MTQYLQIEIIKTGAVLKLTYRKKFIRLELVSGKLTGAQLSYIGKIIPPAWDDLEALRNAYGDKCTYTPIIKEKSIYQQYVDAWYSFYERVLEMPPRFNAADGQNLKQIISHLGRLEGTDQKGLALWQAILSSWEKLDKFHRENTDLKYINSRLNIILNNVRRVHKTSGNNANDFR